MKGFILSPILFITIFLIISVIVLETNKLNNLQSKNFELETKIMRMQFEADLNKTLMRSDFIYDCSYRNCSQNFLSYDYLRDEGNVKISKSIVIINDAYYNFTN